MTGLTNSVKIELVRLMAFVISYQKWNEYHGLSLEEITSLAKKEAQETSTAFRKTL